MRFLYRNIVVLFLLLLGIFSSFSQETDPSIDLIYFNNEQDVIYSPGSGVSVHIDPKGVYELIDMDQDGAITQNDLEQPENNSFILELSSAGGSFANPTTLATVNDFYTPLINGVIPAGTASGNYKLRVRATKGVVFDSDFNETGGYSQPIVETESFSIDSSTETFSGLGLSSNLQNTSTTYDCIELFSNSLNPHFGSVTVSAADVTTAEAAAGDAIKLFPSSLSDQSTYTVNLKGISSSANDQTLTIEENNVGVEYIALPDLPVGTYNIEIQEVTTGGKSSFISVTLLWHTRIKNLETAVGSVCVGTDADIWVLNASIILAMEQLKNYIL